jgi:hypothetical protein
MYGIATPLTPPTAKGVKGHHWRQFHFAHRCSTSYLGRLLDLDLPGVPPGYRLVENELHDCATDSLWKREQARAKGIATHRNLKKNREPDRNIATPDKRAALAAQSARMEAEYRARIAASRASKAAPDNGEGSSSGPPSVYFSTGTIPHAFPPLVF